MSSLNRKEIVGFISLAIIVIAILLGAFILHRNETDSYQTPELKPAVLPADSDYDDGRDARSSSRSRKSTRKKNSSNSSRSSAKKEKEPVIEYDPFSDTIPVDFDDY